MVATDTGPSAAPAPCPAGRMAASVKSTSPSVPSLSVGSVPAGPAEVQIAGFVPSGSGVAAARTVVGEGEGQESELVSRSGGGALGISLATGASAAEANMNNRLQEQHGQVQGQGSGQLRPVVKQEPTSAGGAGNPRGAGSSGGQSQPQPQRQIVTGSGTVSEGSRGTQASLGGNLAVGAQRSSETTFGEGVFRGAVTVASAADGSHPPGIMGLSESLGASGAGIGGGGAAGISRTLEAAGRAAALADGVLPSGDDVMLMLMSMLMLMLRLMLMVLRLALYLSPEDDTWHGCHSPLLCLCLSLLCPNGVRPPYSICHTRALGCPPLSATFFSLLYSGNPL